jgi:hypothetical protein
MPRNSIEKQASPFLHRHQQRNSHVTSVVNVTIFKLVYGNARAKSCNVNVQFLFLARIVAVTASNHFCLLPAYPREHCTSQMPKNELTLPRGGCTPPLITLWSYPASPRTALITVAPILDRSLPTVYQLTAQHSLLRFQFGNAQSLQVLRSASAVACLLLSQVWLASLFVIAKAQYLGLTWA